MRGEIEIPYINRALTILSNSRSHSRYQAVHGVTDLRVTRANFRMAFTYVFTFLVLSATMTTVICQTFQYSHGWTNGKRSSPMLEELVNPASKNAGQLDNVLVNCELQKLKLLLQGNVNSQLLQIPCDLFTSPKRSFSETMTGVDHFRRQPASANNNY